MEELRVTVARKLRESYLRRTYPQRSIYVQPYDNLPTERQKKWLIMADAAIEAVNS